MRCSRTPSSQFRLVWGRRSLPELLCLTVSRGSLSLTSINLWRKDYRWFPEGKVVFVAPTKPLVAQQIEASHKACGIPGSDAAEMTGEIPRAKRERLVCSLTVRFVQVTYLLS